MEPDLHLESKIPPWIVGIASKLHQHRFVTYLVGGAIRNIILGKPIGDYDLATDAKPSEVLKIFKHTIPTGIKFGTVTVFWKGNKAEITTLRGESNYADGRHPESVRFSHDILDDLSRRDFTINAMAYDILSHRFYDPYNGLQNAKQGIVKTVGRARQRFKEDALRMLRAVRLASQYNLLMTHNLTKICKSFHRKLNCVSKERIGVEFHKIVMSDFLSVGVHNLCTSYLLSIVNVDFNLLRYIGDRLAGNNIFASLFDINCRLRITDPTERYALFIISITHHMIQDEGSIGNTMEMVDSIGSSFIKCGLKKRMVDNACSIARAWHNLYLERENTIDLYATLIRLIGKERIGAFYRVVSSLPLSWLAKVDMSLLAWCCRNITAYSTKDLMITGTDLIQLGLTRGIEIGNTLSALLAAVINNPAINTKYDLLKLAKDIHSL